MRTYVRLGIVGAMVAGFVAGAVAQVPQASPPAGQPAAPGQFNRQMARRGAPNADRAAAIRAQIEERWGQRVQAELGLTDQQMDRLRTAQRANQDRHRDLNQREADLIRGVMDQLRPGVAANSDSLNRALDGIAAIRVQRAQAEQQELRDLSQFLNPVQRARLMLMRQQLMNRIDQIRRGGAPGMGAGFGQGMGPGGPGMGPGMMPPRVRRDSQPDDQ